MLYIQIDSRKLVLFIMKTKTSKELKKKDTDTVPRAVVSAELSSEVFPLRLRVPKTKKQGLTPEALLCSPGSSLTWFGPWGLSFKNICREKGIPFLSSS